MYALVLFICYLDGGCDDIAIDIFHTEEQCLAAMNEQRLRHAGCYPIDEFIDGFWRPAQEFSDF
ncbi:YebW family protein [Entomohabitans teleogrylli]|uniref:YebW family protein n=1 Tax=Entomohabitans teleogrylli TaxID=1384589 RepID=UPI00073D7ABC|nr:YebW family protein [Entomohabitans teleogrylli]